MVDLSIENDYEDSDGMNGWSDDIVNNGLNDDLVELNGLNTKTLWKFPSCLTKCPECSAEFDSRSDIIAHYKEEHSADTILCHLCDWPILGTNFQMHFRLLHPNDANPFHFNDGPQSEISSPQVEEAQSESEKSESEKSESENDEVCFAVENWNSTDNFIYN